MKGKYSPYIKLPFVPDHWEEGSEGRVEVDKEGYDRYGYDCNGKDKSGRSEDDYMLMSDEEYENAS